VSGYHADNIGPALLGGFVLVRCVSAAQQRLILACMRGSGIAQRLILACMRGSGMHALIGVGTA
jgi:homoserine kinase